MKQTLFVCFLHIFCIVVGISDGQVCPPGLYYNSTIADHDLGSQNTTTGASCEPCSTCKQGEGVAIPCTNIANTVCRPCLEGYEYSYYNGTSKSRQCLMCTNCSAQHKHKDTACNVTMDSVCGHCVKNYFLYVDFEGNAECRRCSICPEDGWAVHWYECQQAGLPSDQQCAPGYEKPSVDSLSVTLKLATVNTSLLFTTTTNSTTPATTVSRGGFINQVEAGVVTSEMPVTIIGATISALSLVFTVATLLAVVVGCGLNRHCLRRVCSLRTRQNTSNNTSGASAKNWTYYGKCKTQEAKRKDLEFGHEQCKVMSGKEALLDNEEKGDDTTVQL